VDQVAFIQEYRAAARQLNRYETGLQWAGFAKWLAKTHGITLTAAAAAQWANIGYFPREALHLIVEGVTPETADEMENLAVDLAGGPEQRKAQRIAELEQSGQFIGPRLVRWREDPDDPEHIIVDIEPE
jgi:hypothetical protein